MRNINSFGDYIKNKRKELNYSREKLAKSLKVTKSTIYRWENNQTKPNGENIFKIMLEMNLASLEIKCEKGFFRK